MLDIAMMTRAIMQLLVGSPHPVDEGDDSLGGNFPVNNSITARNDTINQLAVDRNLENTA